MPYRCRPGVHSGRCEPEPGARGRFPCRCGCREAGSRAVVDICEGLDVWLMDLAHDAGR